jgi:D,D-heptose 1,7-bisphosphate phosphatase
MKATIQKKAKRIQEPTPELSSSIMCKKATKINGDITFSDSTKPLVYSYKTSENSYSSAERDNTELFSPTESKSSLDNKKKQKAIFLDRDGVINVEKSYITKPDELEVFEYTPQAIKKINQSEYKAIVITNQSAIAQDMFSLEELHAVHEKLESILNKEGALIDGLYFCPHYPNKNKLNSSNKFLINCECRKPKAGMFLQAAKDFNLDMQNSIMIGDTERDILAGKNAGCYTAGVMTGYGLKDTTIYPDFLFSDLLNAANFLTDTKHEKTFTTLSEASKNSSKPFIIGIGGNDRTGKSTLAAFLKMRFEQSGAKVLKIELDNWIIPKANQHNEKDALAKFDIEKLIKDIHAILDGNKISIRANSKYPKGNSREIIYAPDSPEILIIEGTIALSIEELRKLYTKKIFLITNKNERLSRLIKYHNWIGETKVEIESLTRSYLSDIYRQIEKDSRFADIILNN